MQVSRGTAIEQVGAALRTFSCVIAFTLTVTLLSCCLWKPRRRDFESEDDTKRVASLIRGRAGPPLHLSRLLLPSKHFFFSTSRRYSQTRLYLHSPLAIYVYTRCRLFTTLYSFSCLAQPPFTLILYICLCVAWRFTPFTQLCNFESERDRT
jgi:hypothetical protein